MHNFLFTRWLRRIFRNEDHWDEMFFFRAVPIFNGLTSMQLGRVMQATQKRRYIAGEVLFEEGQIGKAVFIIKSAKVELSRRAPSGRRVLGLLGPSQFFGEMALLEQMQRTASATVVQDGEIYLLYTATLDNLIRSHPAIGVKLMKNIAIMLSALLRRTNQEQDQRRSAA